MTELDVRQEICEVFSTPMGLTSEDIKKNTLLPFYTCKVVARILTVCHQSTKQSLNGMESTLHHLLKPEHICTC